MFPNMVAAAIARATEAGFAMSCGPEVGQLLAVLAAAVPVGGRILELGTGCGVGLAWITHGLGERSDVEVVSVEAAHEVVPLARAADWPPFVSIVEGDAVALLPRLGEFDLVFADAEGGKWERLDLTLAAVRLRGMLIVDDMTPARWESELHQTKTSEVRTQLLSNPMFITDEVAHGTGVIVSTRQRP